MKLYAVKDKACGIVHVFTANNDFGAMRSMAMLMDNDPMSTIAKYASDFDLLNLGELNSDTGEINQEKVTFVCNMSDLKRKDEKND